MFAYFQDFNDNQPKFISPPRNFTIRIAENASVGEEVIRVRAIDTDIGVNGQVRYRIRKDPLGNYRSFEIDPETGIIILVQPLDRERQKVYEIRVEAYDLGIPTPLQSDLDLTIYVRNINDHEPQFLVDEFEANFTEHKRPGLEHVLLVNTVDRDDEDEDGEILDVCYFIVNGNEDGMFELVSLEHELLINRELDREAKATYELVVKATEECLTLPEWARPGADEIKFDPRDDTLLKVIVRVKDIDDNAPKFTQQVFTGGISTDVDYGAGFMKITAEDLDEGPNAELEYSLDGNIVPSAESEGLENIRKPPFLITHDTGVVILNFDPQKGMKGYFDFRVKVTDKGGHVDHAKVQIYLLREDQRVKFVVRSNPAEIRRKMNAFRLVLANVTDAIVNVDDFKVHETPEGNVDKTKTDVYLHLVNPQDNSVMEVSEVLKLIDYRTEELDEVFREFDVLNTEGVDPTFVRTASTETVMLYWLFGICLFLIMLLIIVLCICMHQRKKYNRKLRAATTSAFGDQATDSILNKREIVPNTNRHASEGSNPIWMTGVGYDNMQFKATEEEEEIVRSRNDLNSRFQGQMEHQLDSLDANVLNDSIEDHNMMPTHQEEDEDMDIGYAASHFSNGGSTIRVGSANKLIESPRSSSSGLGSGNSRKFDLSKGGPINGLYSKNMTIAALFPSQMPPVEKLASTNPGFGNTVYDDDDVPRTEL